MSSPAYSGKGIKKNAHKYNFEQKVLKKLHLVMKNKEKLKLSEDQLTKINNLDADTRKDLIKVKAEIDLIDVDIKSKLWVEPIDTKGANELIDQKYELKKQKAKTLIATYSQLKEILSKEQEEDLKKLMPHESKERMKKKHKK